MTTLGLATLVLGQFASAHLAQATVPCGAVTYNRATEPGTFLWNDCATGQWRLRAVAGGSTSGIYAGSIAATRPFASITPYSLEATDTLDTSTPGQAAYVMRVGGSGEDGIDFALATTASACLDAGGPVVVGPNRTRVSSPFDIATLGACVSDPPVDRVVLPYLEDADTTDSVRSPSGSDLGDRAFPRITTGPLKQTGTAEQFSKYGVIAVKAAMFRWVSQVQAINPRTKALRIHCPQEYQGFDDKDACRLGNGIPFGSTGPATANCSVYAGHWLYAPGATLRSDIAANTTTIQVSDASRFNANRYVVIYDGRPGSFLNAEHARVTAVNVATGTLTLANRGYKSVARLHPAGAIVAEHVVGNGSTEGGLVAENWVYNHATTSPVDSSGRQINEVMAEWLAANYAKDAAGQASPVRLEGILFDSDFHFIKDSGHNKRPDVNNDLVLDDGVSPTGENWWGEGLDRFYTEARERLPHLTLVGGVTESRGYTALNGAPFEGWPHRNIGSASPDYRDIGGRLSTYSIQMHYGNQGPRYSEGFNRMSNRLYPYGSVVATSNAPFRFSFGLILLDDGHYGHQNTYVRDPWWDEYAVDVVPGSRTFGQAIDSNPTNESLTRRHTGWMGMPLGPRYRVYDLETFAPDHNLMPSGTFDSGLGDWQSSNVSVRVDTAVNNRFEGSGSLYISKHSNYVSTDFGASASGPTVQLTGGVDYTLAFAVKSTEIRSLQIAMGDSTQTYYIPAKWSRQVMTFRPTRSGSYRLKFNVGKENSELWIDSIYLFQGNADVFRRDFENAVVVVNATASPRTVDLDGSFQRIRGTGQDPINDGSTVRQVVIAAYDSAILVRP